MPNVTAELTAGLTAGLTERGVLLEKLSRLTSEASALRFVWPKRDMMAIICKEAEVDACRAALGFRPLIQVDIPEVADAA